MDKEKLIRLYYTKNTVIDILNTKSETNFLYKINVPFQITYEYCSGTGSKDYLNIITLSEKGSYFSQELTELHNYVFHTKAPHFHDYYEFLIVLKGSVSQQIEGKDYLYPEGSCCLINRNLCHKELFGESSQILFLGFSMTFFLSLLDSISTAYFPSEKEIQNTLLYQFVKNDIITPGRKTYLDFIPIYKNQNASSDLHQLANDLIETMMYPKFGSTYQINALICNILQYISSPEKYHCTQVQLSENSNHLLFARIEHLIKENHGQISRTELAQALHYSSDYINRIVNKYTGMNLHKYAMRFCMQEAARLLSNTDETISTIAESLNFSNKTYFYTLFKEQYGMTPKEYRQKENFKK